MTTDKRGDTTADGSTNGDATADGSTTDRTRTAPPDDGGSREGSTLRFDTGALFDPDHYLPTLDRMLEEGQSDREAEFLAETLSLSAGDRVLDVPCGHGRHANRLAERGYDVSGLDASEAFLDLAREDARERGVDPEYVHGDMRDLPWDEDAFDAAYNVFTSFGYFDEEGNRRVLSELARVVKPGGRLVVELADRDALLREFSPESVTRFEDGDLMAETREYDPRTGRVRTDRTTVVDGAVRSGVYEVRLYSHAELADLFDRAGFEVVADYGDLTGSEYSLETPGWRSSASAGGDPGSSRIGSSRVGSGRSPRRVDGPPGRSPCRVDGRPGGSPTGADGHL